MGALSSAGAFFLPEKPSTKLDTLLIAPGIISTRRSTVLMDEEEAEALEEDDAVMIARIEFDTDGEPVYVDPTDEEFEAVKKAYEEITQEMDEE